MDWTGRRPIAFFLAMTNSVRARRLALSIIDGEWTQNALKDRLQRAFSASAIDCKRLAARLLFLHSQPPRSFKKLARALLDESLLEPFWQHTGAKDLPGILLDPPLMQPPPAHLRCFPLPRLDTSRDVARWLAVHPRQLDWLADVAGTQANVIEPKVHHYRYRWVNKRSGGQRLIEIPKSQLKAIQRQILSDILNRVLPHDNAHGFVQSRSCMSYVKSHVGQATLLHLDLKNFFHSVPINKVFALFHTLGYPPNVSRILMGLCSHVVSASLAGRPFAGQPWQHRKQLQLPHLPQGAPTSGALANFCAYRLDCRLTGLADHHGLNYSRYADDLVFSGPASLRKQAEWMESVVGSIALEEGFCLNHRKTRVKSQSQSQRITGLVINDKINISRADYDQLKAILYNCQRHGSLSQNRDNHPDFRAYLAGKIAYVRHTNVARGEKLQQLFNAIDWQQSAPSH